MQTLASEAWLVRIYMYAAFIKVSGISLALHELTRGIREYAAARAVKILKSPKANRRERERENKKRADAVKVRQQEQRTPLQPGGHVYPDAMPRDAVRNTLMEPRFAQFHFEQRRLL